MRVSAFRALGAGAVMAASGAFAGEVVYDDGALRAVAHADCDGSDYVIVTAPDGGARVAKALAPRVADILDAALPRLAERCGETGAATVTVVGVAGALPVHAVAASRAADWAPGSAPADARALAFLAPALPESDGGDCAPPRDFAALRTKAFTAKVARTAGHWNPRETLDALVPVHREVMAMAARSGFEWRCAHAFEVTALAVEVDRARAQSLRENLDDLLALEPAALAEAAFGGREPAPIDNIRGLVVETAAGPAIRFGGFAYPAVVRVAEAAGPAP